MKWFWLSAYNHKNLVETKLNKKAKFYDCFQNHLFSADGLILTSLLVQYDTHNPQKQIQIKNAKFRVKKGEKLQFDWNTPNCPKWERIPNWPFIDPNCRVCAQLMATAQGPRGGHSQDQRSDPLPFQPPPPTFKPSFLSWCSSSIVFMLSSLQDISILRQWASDLIYHTKTYPVQLPGAAPCCGYSSSAVIHPADSAHRLTALSPNL